MSFAYDLKTELGENRPHQPAQRWAQAYGLLLYNRNFPKGSLNLVTEHEGVAELYTRVLEEYFGQVPKISASQSKGEGKPVHYTVVSSQKDSYLRAAQKIGFHPKNTGVGLDLMAGPAGQAECAGAFLSGVYLACGLTADPYRSYRLEFVVSSELLGDALAGYLSRLDFRVKTATRMGSQVVYLKESENIEDLMTLMGATKSSLELMNVKVYKDLRNKVNRVTNCETANIGKTVGAAAIQADAIRLVYETMGEESLSEELREVARLRLEHPDLSLKELADIIGLSRSGVNHRLNRICQIAREMDRSSHKE